MFLYLVKWYFAGPREHYVIARNAVDAGQAICERFKFDENVLTSIKKVSENVEIVSYDNDDKEEA